MIEELLENNFITSVDDIKGIGHSVLHGGEFYAKSVVIDDEVLNNIKSLTKLGPLHHLGEIAGIESMKSLLPKQYLIQYFIKRCPKKITYMRDLIPGMKKMV